MAEDRHNPLNEGEPSGAPESDLDDVLIDHMPQDQVDEFEAFVSEELGLESSDDTGQQDTGVEPEEPSEPRVQESAGGGGDSPQGDGPLQPPSDAPPSAPPASQEVVPRYRVGDQLLTAQELIEQGYLNDLITYAAQQSQQQTQQQPQQAQDDPDAVLEQYLPVVDNLVKQGYVESAFAENYPRAMAGFAYLLSQLNETRQYAQQSYQYVHQRQGETQREMVERKVNEAFDTAASAGEFYAPLKNPEERTKFQEWFVKSLNPTFDQVTPEFVQQQFLAYNYKSLQALNNAQKTQSPAQPAAALASSENGSSRSHGVRTVPEEPWADLIQGFLPS